MIDPMDITPDEAIERVTAGINALFAAHRDTLEDERTAYFERHSGTGEFQRYVFVAFANGAMHPEGETYPPIASLASAVSDTIAAVAHAFPGHSALQVVWRSPASYSEWEKGSHVVGGARHYWEGGRAIYVHLTATPLGA